MTISEPFIRRPVMTIVLTVSVILFGVLAYFALPVNDLPAVDYPVIQVSVDYPGATPETMANNVATPLERQFMQIPGLEIVTSNSRQGHTSFVLQFALTKSIDAAATDVQAAISQAQGQLPVDLPTPPTFTKTNPNDQPIMYIGPGERQRHARTALRLREHAGRRADQHSSRREPGAGVRDAVGRADQGQSRRDGGPQSHDGRPGDGRQERDRYTGAGQFDGASRTFLLQPQGQLSEASQYNELIVGQANGAPLRVKDVAVVKDTLQDERIKMRFWVRGQHIPTATVVIAVFRQAGSNAVEVAEAVRGLLPSIQAELPARS